MACPEYLYYAAMFLIALPVAWVTRSVPALLIFLVWALGQAAYEAGLPEELTQFVLYSSALFAGWCCKRTETETFAVLLFVPLAMTCALQIIGWINDLQAWWTIYWLALAQVGSLALLIDWRKFSLRRLLARIKGSGSEDMLHVRHA